MIRGDYLRCCKICYPLCAFVILAACVVACVGLVWMQVALKEDLDALKEKFRTSKWLPFSECYLASRLTQSEPCRIKSFAHSDETIIYSFQPSDTLS